MDFLELVKERYSCKKFSDKVVPDDKLSLILEAGRLAPTAKNSQEFKIYVAKSDEAFKKIDATTPCRYNAKTVLLVAYDKNGEYIYPGEKIRSGAEDVAIVATHMMLMAKNVGVDSCWINCFDPTKLKELLELPESEEIVMLLDIGYPSDGIGPLPNHNSRKQQ